MQCLINFFLCTGDLLKYRHLGDNAQLVVIKDVGHAFSVEKPKEFYKHMKSFLVDLQFPPSPTSPPPMDQNKKTS